MRISKALLLLVTLMAAAGAAPYLSGAYQGPYSWMAEQGAWSALHSRVDEQTWNSGDDVDVVLEYLGPPDVVGVGHGTSPSEPPLNFSAYRTSGLVVVSQAGKVLFFTLDPLWVDLLLDAFGPD